jgi:GTPase SAR1 family protein
MPRMEEEDFLTARDSEGCTLQKMEAVEELEDVECKVVLVGDSRCGKTALVQRFVGDNFVEVRTRPSV